MEEMAATWSKVGTGAREVFLMQKVDELMRIVMGTVADLKVERLTMLGGLGGGPAGSGNGVPAVSHGDLGGLAGRLVAANEQIKAASGVDLLGAAQQRLATTGADRSR